MKINHEKFNDGKYIVNDDLHIFTFNKFWEIFFEIENPQNLNEIAYKKMYEFFENVNETKENLQSVLRGETPPKYTNVYLNKYPKFENFSYNQQSINGNVFNDLMWYANLEFFPIIKSLNYMMENGFDDSNTLIIYYNVLGDEQIIIVNLLYEQCLFCGCFFDEFKPLKNEHENLWLYYSILNGLFEW